MIRAAATLLGLGVLTIGAMAAIRRSSVDLKPEVTVIVMGDGDE